MLSAAAAPRVFAIPMPALPRNAAGDDEATPFATPIAAVSAKAKAPEPLSATLLPAAGAITVLVERGAGSAGAITVLVAFEPCAPRPP
jgi:hypothetical protein